MTRVLKSEFLGGGPVTCSEFASRHMTLRLRSLFIILGIAAVAISWFNSLKSTTQASAVIRVSAVRQSPLGRLTSKPANSVEDSFDFESRFYQQAMMSFKTSHPSTYQKMSNPSSEIRDRIQLCELRKTRDAIYYSIDGRGNPLTADGETAELLFESGLLALEPLQQSLGGKWRISIINRVDY